MRKFNFVILMLAMVVFVASCGTSARIGKEKTVSSPLSVSSKDSKDDLRAIANGTSLDWNVARNIATVNCRGELALKLKAQVKSNLENYAKQYGQSDSTFIKRDLDQKFEQYTITSADIDLIGAKEIESKVTQNSKTNQYTYWTCMEISRDAINKATMQAYTTITNGDKNATDQEEAQFKQFLKDNK